jgi:glutamate synthase (NADPH/NADH) large chain
MSGGVAYILDLDASLVNPELVELNDLSESDSDELRELLIAHIENTDSAVGRELIDEWGSAVARFTKVIPRDYKRILAIEAQARITGEDPMVAIMSSI